MACARNLCHLDWSLRCSVTTPSFISPLTRVAAPTSRCVGTVPSVSIAASFVDESGLDAFVDAYAEFSAMQSLVKIGASVMT